MWQIQGNAARFHSPRLSMQLPWQQAWQGITFTQFAGQQLVATTFPQPRVAFEKLVNSAEPVADHYVRRNDLVVTYNPAPPHKVQVQLYFRAWLPEALDQAAGVEMILSAQTDLLDASPAVRSHSVWSSAPAELLAWSANANDEQFQSVLTERENSSSRCVLARQPNSPSYFEMIHPTDFAGVSISTQELSWQLFPDRMEKGVIRRVRWVCVLLPAKQDTEIAIAAFQAFEHEPLPLTT